MAKKSYAKQTMDCRITRSSIWPASLQSPRVASKSRINWTVVPVSSITAITYMDYFIHVANHCDNNQPVCEEG